MRDAEAHGARDDRDLPDRVGARREHPDQRVAGLVVGGAPLVGRGEQQLARGSELDLLERVGEVAHRHLLVRAARREERRLVGEVREVGADHAGRRRGERVQVDVRRERDVARVDEQDLLAAVLVRRLNRHAAVEASRPQQRRVEHVGAVRRGEDDDAGRGVEAVHLGQDLVERLLALVVGAAEGARAARAADRVDLVDEDDRRGGRLRLREQVAHAGGADADDHLDELRRRHREERHAGLARDGPREQRLARCPGEPVSRTPRGMWAPSLRYLSGSRRKSTTSASSSFASSMPATSAKRDLLRRRLVLLRLRACRRRTCCRCPTAA